MERQTTKINNDNIGIFTYIRQPNITSMVRKLLLLFACTFSLLFSQNTELKKLEASFQKHLERTEYDEAIRTLDRLVYLYKDQDTAKANRYIAEAQSLAEAQQSVSYRAYVSLMRGYLIAINPQDAEAARIIFTKASALADSIQNDTLSILAKIHLGTSLITGKRFDEAVSMLESTIEKAKGLNRLQDMAHAYDRLGMAYGIQKKHEESAKAGAEAVRIAEEAGLSSKLKMYIRNHCIALYYLGKQEEVAKSLLEVAKIEEREGDSIGFLYTLNNLQVVLNEVEDYATAAQYGQKALAILEHKSQKQTETATLANLATSYRFMGLNDSALIFNQKAIILSKELGMVGREAILYSNMLGIYDAMGNVAEIEKTVPIVLKLREEHPEARSQTTIALTYVGQLYADKGRFQEALPYLEEANTFLKQNNEASTLAKNSAALAKTYAALGRHKEAYEVQNQSHIIKDSLLNRDKVRAITKLESEYQFEKEREKQELAFELERERARLIRTGLIVGLTLTALVLFFIFRNYRNQQKANQLLLEKNTQIEEQKTQLAGLNDTKDRIFSIIGHDLRKPAISFRGIGKKVNYLLKKQDYETLNKLGSEIERDALSLNKLTDDLLSWALLQKDVMPYNPTEVQVHGVVEETMALFNQVAKDKSISLINNVPENLDLYADLNGLRSMLRNLIDNGIKFTPEGGTVRVEAQSEKDAVKIVVEDTGVGISKAKLHDIHLLKADKSEQGTAGEKGSGLGLHLVDELARLNRGRLEILSELGEGTRVGITLPSMQTAL